MGHLFVTVPAAVVVFASTNVDDLVVLTMLFVASRAAGTPRPWQIVAGQGAGIAALVASSAVAALGLLIVPYRWAWIHAFASPAIGRPAPDTSAVRARGMPAGS